MYSMHSFTFHRIPPTLQSFCVAYSSANEEDCLKQEVKLCPTLLEQYRRERALHFVDYSTAATLKETKSTYGLLKVEFEPSVCLFVSSKLYYLRDGEGAVKVYMLYVCSSTKKNCLMCAPRASTDRRKGHPS